MKFYRFEPVNLDEILYKFNAQPLKLECKILKFQIHAKFRPALQKISNFLNSSGSSCTMPRSMRLATTLRLQSVSCGHLRV